MRDDVIDETQIERTCDVWKRMDIHEARTLADRESAVIKVVEKSTARFWLRGRETKATV